MIALAVSLLALAAAKADETDARCLPRGDAPLPAACVEESRKVLEAADHQAICADPALAICDPQLNPAISLNLAREERFAHLEEQAERESDVQSYLAAHKRGAKRCFELSPSHFEKCQALAQARIRKALNTEDRMKQARKVFEQARAAVARALASHRKVLESTHREALVKELDQMSAQLGRATLSFDVSPGETVYQYNSAEGTKGLLFKDPVVHADGYALLGTAAPELLLKTFMHELSHAAGTNRWGKKFSSRESGPYALEFKCLMRRDTVWMKTTDAACYAQRGASDCAANARENPRINYVCHDLDDEPNGDPCTHSQAEETFADLLAAEAYSDERGPLLRELAALQPPADLSARLRRAPQLLEAFADNCDREGPDSPDSPDSNQKELIYRNASWPRAHLPGPVRVNLYFAQPRLRQALGCRGAEVPVITDANAPVGDLDTRAFCGAPLYGGGP